MILLAALMTAVAFSFCRSSWYSDALADPRFYSSATKASEKGKGVVKLICLALSRDTQTFRVNQ
jgi:hypothetical protein